jgi:hypothetical protein
MNSKINLIIFAITLVFAITFASAQVSHTVDEISGLNDYINSNMGLYSKPSACPSGQCVRSIDSSGDIHCISGTNSISGTWEYVSDNTKDCSWNCRNIGYAYAVVNTSGKMCKDISGKAGNYLQASGGNPNFQWCISTSPASSGILQQCYCKGKLSASGCPSATTLNCTFSAYHETTGSSNQMLYGVCPSGQDAVYCDAAGSRGNWMYRSLFDLVGPSPSWPCYDTLGAKSCCSGQFYLKYKCLQSCNY